MRLLAALFTLAMLSTASAQHAPLPKTINLFNKATKESLGTATYSGNHIYLRDPKGELYATMEVAKDGKVTTYDADGKVIELPGIATALPK